MRIGVLGGSFDPVHVGHLIAARAARERLRLDQVRLVPAREQPFKVGRHGAPAADRFALLQAAVAGDPALVADPCELERDGPSYTVDTLRHLRRVFPGDALFFLIGADAARQLPQWREAGALSDLATIVVMTRPGQEPPAGVGHERVEVPAIEVSASDIRARCGRGADIRDLVPDAVRALIVARRLYVERD